MGDKASILATVLGALGVLFFMAMAFGVLPSRLAIFAGIACFVLAGTTRRIAAQNKY
jgi:hypothetical protein